MICMYRHFDNKGNLLYVGSTSNFFSRTYNHKNSAWSKNISSIEIVPCETIEDAKKMERSAIDDESPIFNNGLIETRALRERENSESIAMVLERVHGYLSSVSIREAVHFAVLAKLSLPKLIELMDGKGISNAQTVCRMRSALAYIEASTSPA